jgi:hypothetical protein
MRGVPVKVSKCQRLGSATNESHSVYVWQFFDTALSKTVKELLAAASLTLFDTRLSKTSTNKNTAAYVWNGDIFDTLTL